MVGRGLATTFAAATMLVAACGAPSSTTLHYSPSTQIAADFPTLYDDHEEAQLTRRMCLEAGVEPNQRYAFWADSAAMGNRPLRITGVSIGPIGFTRAWEQTPSLSTGVLQNGEHTQTAESIWPLQGGREHFLVLETGDDPFAEPKLRIEVGNEAGRQSVRVHLCKLIARKYVEFPNHDDVQFGFRLLNPGHNVLSVEVPADAQPPSDADECGTSTRPGIEIRAGEGVSFLGFGGRVRLGSVDSTWFGPEGSTKSSWIRNYNYSDLWHMNHGALVWQWNGEPHSIEDAEDFIAAEDGCLTFFINDTDRSNNRGSYVVALDIETRPRAARRRRRRQAITPG